MDVVNGVDCVVRRKGEKAGPELRQNCHIFGAPSFARVCLPQATVALAQPPTDGQGSRATRSESRSPTCAPAYLHDITFDILLFFELYMLQLLCGFTSEIHVHVASCCSY